jgi:hypothetical protein
MEAPLFDRVIRAIVQPSRLVSVKNETEWHIEWHGTARPQGRAKMPLPNRVQGSLI